MDLKYLNLNRYDIPKDAKIQVSVLLIATDLKTRKLMNAFASIGCDGSFCLPDLCDLVLTFVGFDNRPDELYDYYFDLLEKHCEKVTHENDPPIEEAFCIYKQLDAERQRRLVSLS